MIYKLLIYLNLLKRVIIKIIFIIPLVKIFTLEVNAQESDNQINKKHNFYIGLSASTMSYKINYKNLYANGTSSSIIPIPYVTIGYKINRRATVQTSFAYGVLNDHHYVTYYGKQDSVINYHDYSRTNGLVLPVTINFVVINTNRSVPIYTSLSFVPVYSNTKVKGTSEYINKGITTNRYSDVASGLGAYITGGLGITYKITKRLKGSSEILLLKNNLDGRNPYPYPFYKTFYTFKSIATSINYHF